MTVTNKPTTLRERRHAATAEAMLEAAERAIVKHGYEQATMQQIAAETGCAPGTFYLYFKNKQELFEALLVRHMTAIHAACRAAMAGAGDPLEKLQTSMAAAVQYSQDHQQFFQVAFTAMPIRQRALRERFAQIGWNEPEEFRQYNESLLRQAQRQGLIRRDLPTGVLLDFMDAVIFSFMEQFSSSTGRRSPQEQMRILWGLITGGLGGKEAT